MRGRKNNLSFSDMSVQKLGTHVMEVQMPYLKQELETVLLCFAKNIMTTNVADRDFPKMADVVKRLGALIGKHFKQEEKSLFQGFKIRPANEAELKKLEVFCNKMKKEHKKMISLFENLRELSDNYKAGPSFPATKKLCYAQLFNFEQDMLKHIFLEEDIIFPKLLQQPLNMSQQAFTH